MLATVCAEGLGVVEFEEGHVDAGLARIEESLVARQAIGGDDLLKVGLAEYSTTPTASCAGPSGCSATRPASPTSPPARPGPGSPACEVVPPWPVATRFAPPR